MNIFFKTYSFEDSAPISAKIDSEVEPKNPEIQTSYLSSVIPIVSSIASYGFSMLNDYDPYAEFSDVEENSEEEIINEVEDDGFGDISFSEDDDFEDISFSEDDDFEDISFSEEEAVPPSLLSKFTASAGSIGSFGLKAAIFFAGAGGGDLYGSAEDDDCESEISLKDRIISVETLCKEVMVNGEEILSVAKDKVVDAHVKTQEILKVIINTPKEPTVVRDPNLVALEKEILKVAFPLAGSAAGLLETVVEHVWSPLSGVFKPIFGKSYYTDILDGGIVTGFIQKSIQEQKEILLNKLENGEATLRSLIPSNAVPLKVTVAGDQGNFIVRIIKKVATAVVFVFRAIANFFYTVALKLGIINAPKQTVKTPEEATNDLVRKFTDNIKTTLAVKNLWVRASQKVSGIFSSAIINHSLKLVRENVFGAQNQQKMEAILDAVQESVIMKLTEELSLVNNLLLPVFDDSPFAVSLDKEDELLRKLSEKSKLHPAVPYLTSDEKLLLAKKDILLLKVSGFAKKQEATLYVNAIAEHKSGKLIALKELDREIVELEKQEKVHIANGNPTKSAEWKLKVTQAKAAKPLRIAELNNNESLFINEILALEALEKRITTQESDYINSLSVQLVDHVLFPNGMPSSFKNLLWVAGIAVDPQFKDARAYILNQLNTVLADTINNNLGNPQKLELMLDKLLIKLPTSNSQIIKDRLGMSHVNKHILFSVLDEAVKTLKEKTA